MSLSNAINFITCIFIYEPLKTRVTSLDSGDADGLMHIAEQLGYTLSEEELLLALELTVDHMVLGDAPAPEEIVLWAQQKRANWKHLRPMQFLTLLL